MMSYLCYPALVEGEFGKYYFMLNDFLIVFNVATR